MIDDKEKLRFYLRKHARGYYNRKTVQRISQALQLPIYRIRQLIRELKDEGMLIACLSEDNYCLSEKFDEKTYHTVNRILLRLSGVESYSRAVGY